MSSYIEHIYLKPFLNQDMEHFLKDFLMPFGPPPSLSTPRQPTTGPVSITTDYLVFSRIPTNALYGIYFLWSGTRQ